MCTWFVRACDGSGDVTDVALFVFLEVIIDVILMLFDCFVIDSSLHIRHGLCKKL